MQVSFGIDNLIALAPRYKNHRVGLVTNNVATTVDGRQSRVALLQAGFNITRLFSPEHGLNAEGADGSFQQSIVDVHTALPVTSLYGDHLQPTAADLADIDLMIFDLPDVGCRFYTYQWTLSYIMQACSAANMPLIVCDRPNPISGDFALAEGPMLDATCASFIGRWNIPIRHSCTIGELAGFWKIQHGLQLDLTVIQLKNWNRHQFFADLQIPFIPPSPGIRDVETALLYPGTGLLEGINLNEGRGTDKPFKICGAPWIDAHQLSGAFNGLGLAGITASATRFTPIFGRYAHEICHGIEFSVTDARVFRAVTTGLSLLNLVLQLYPGSASPALYPTNANPGGEGHLEKLTGVPGIWELLNCDPASFQQQLESHVNIHGWRHDIAGSLLYY
ncbi:MAG: DUF1343 domain-containing protein [Bacteroidota bacterium]